MPILEEEEKEVGDLQRGGRSFVTSLVGLVFAVAAWVCYIPTRYLTFSQLPDQRLLSIFSMIFTMLALVFTWFSFRTWIEGNMRGSKARISLIFTIIALFLILLYGVQRFMYR